MSPDIKFIYQGSDYFASREVVCSKLCQAAATIIPLPDKIEIRFANLGPSVYGNTRLEYRFRNRVSVHSLLQLREIPGVLVHELIHLSQAHTGMLRVTSTGVYYWNGVPYRTEDALTMNYDTHQSLPWEIDVSNRHASVLKETLAAAMKLG